MENGVIFLIGKGSQHLGFRGRSVDEHLERLVGMSGQDHVVEPFLARRTGDNDALVLATHRQHRRLQPRLLSARDRSRHARDRSARNEAKAPEASVTLRTNVTRSGWIVAGTHSDTEPPRPRAPATSIETPTVCATPEQTFAGLPVQLATWQLKLVTGAACARAGEVDGEGSVVARRSRLAAIQGRPFDIPRC